MHLHVIGDSLAMERPEEGIGPEDLYWQRLAAHPGHTVTAAVKREQDSAQAWAAAWKAAHDGEITDPLAACDVLILHLGIVDCFPRVFTRRERAFLSWLKRVRLGWLSTRVIAFGSAHRYAITRLRRICYVSPAAYPVLLERIIVHARARGGAQRVCLFSILEPVADKVARNYGLVEAVAAYNDALRGLAARLPGVVFLDLNAAFGDARDRLLLDDGYHITREAHARIAACVQAQLGGDNVIITT
jgi:hypothetical protein